jgi:uncharacterized protein
MPARLRFNVRRACEARFCPRGRSSVGLERRPVTPEAAGSSPVAPVHIVVRTLQLDTPHGQAKAHLHGAPEARAALVLGHGAGAGVSAPDLVAVPEAAHSEGISVALVEQPYRVAGRRSPAPARQLDAVWEAVVEHLQAGEIDGLPLIVGGRSLGARVACRTADTSGAVAVLCLAFPLQPPRRSGRPATPSRVEELDAVAVPALVVQGERDRFGIPPASALREVVEVPGDHGLKADPEAVAAAVRNWLAGVTAEAVPAK